MLDDDEENKKRVEYLFLRCYDWINQGEVLLAAVALSAARGFTLDDFSAFCNAKDRETGKQNTYIKFTISSSTES